MRKIGLLPRLFAAMALGIAVGWLAPDWLVRTTNCFRDTFGQFIKFIVPFIILGLVTPAIIDTGKSAGRLLLMTIGLAWVSTVVFGYFAYGVSVSVFPNVLSGALDPSAAVRTFPAYFALQIPPVMDVVTALVVSLVIGFGSIAIGAEVCTKAADELRRIVMLTLRYAFVPFLPAYILTVMADLTASGKLKAVGGGCVVIMLVALATTTAVLVLQFLVAGLVARKNPLKCLLNMLPAYLTGWGCCSSAATIPYTLDCTKRNGVSDETASLVIPLCSSMHMAGSMANVVVYSAGLLVLLGQGLPLANYTEYILMVSFVAVASPGVPGGVVLATSAIAEAALGFKPEQYAIMIAIYLALDGMGTACNLTGDGAIAILVDRFAGRLKRCATRRAAGCLAACACALSVLLLGGCRIERIVLEEPVRDQLVEVCTDDHVVVRLEENATTGFSWTAKCADPLVNVTVDHEAADAEDRRAGEPGRATVQLRVLRGFIGPATVRLRYARSWSGDCARTVKLVLHRRPTDVAIWK